MIKPLFPNLLVFQSLCVFFLHFPAPSLSLSLHVPISIFYLKTGSIFNLIVFLIAMTTKAGSRFHDYRICLLLPSHNLSFHSCFSSPFSLLKNFSHHLIESLSISLLIFLLAYILLLLLRRFHVSHLSFSLSLSLLLFSTLSFSLLISLSLFIFYNFSTFIYPIFLFFYFHLFESLSLSLFLY